MIEVTKYGNRKLYSKTDKKYLTLNALRDKVRTGTEVKVTDHKTGADVTAKTLAAIVSTLNLDTTKLSKIIKGE